jgi:hypothetical protein
MMLGSGHDVGAENGRRVVGFHVPIVDGTQCTPRLLLC